MRVIRKKYLRQTLLGIAAVLGIFVIIVCSVIYAHHKSHLFSEFRESRIQELKIIALMSQDALLHPDKTEMRMLATRWGKEHEKVLGLKISNPEGSLITGFQSLDPGPDTMVIKHHENFESHTILFELTADTSGLWSELNSLLLELVVVSVLLLSLMAASVWIVLRRFAFTPLKQEILQRKKVLMQLRRVSKENQRLLESAGEGIFSIQRDCTCTFVNDAALAMLGFQREQLIGKNIHNLIHHTDPDGVKCEPENCQILSALTKSEGVIVNEDCFWRSSGASFPVMYSAFPLDEESGCAGVVVVFHDITSQQTERMRLEHQASHDPLTGLVNRREFERRLERAVETARLESKEHVLLYIDLDSFKAVNDSAGHHAGDQLLQRLADLMGHRMRERDTLARLGGDEFAVLLENCSQDVAMRISGEISNEICNYKFSWDGRQFVIGVSIGLAVIDASCQGYDVAMDAADGACYLAKQLGGCQVQAWTPALPDSEKIH